MSKKEDKKIQEIRRKIIPILKEYGVVDASLFGSVAAGEERADSDLDILVKIEDDISLLDFVGLKLELEEKLGRKVDLVEPETIKPALRESILNNQVPIYD